MRNGRISVASMTENLEAIQELSVPVFRRNLHHVGHGATTRAGPSWPNVSASRRGPCATTSNGCAGSAVRCGRDRRLPARGGCANAAAAARRQGGDRRRGRAAGGRHSHGPRHRVGGAARPDQAGADAAVAASPSCERPARSSRAASARGASRGRRHAHRHRGRRATTSGSGSTTSAAVEPLRLAHSRGADTWSAGTSRGPTGARSGWTGCRHRTPSVHSSRASGGDLAGHVATGLATAAWQCRARVTVRAPAEHVRERLPAGVLVESLGEDACDAADVGLLSRASWGPTSRSPGRLDSSRRSARWASATCERFRRVGADPVRASKNPGVR